MITVLRQEWNARKRTIRIVSIAIFVLIFMAVLINAVRPQSPIYIKQLGDFWTAISLTAVFGFLPIFVLSRGAGNLGQVLLKDTNYLMLSVPKKSVVVLGGKVIMGFFELLIYIVPAFFYLLFLLPFESVSRKYWDELARACQTIFIDNFTITINIAWMGIVAFLVIQTVANLAVAIYCSVMKNRKAKFLIFIFMLIALDIMIRTLTYVFGKIEFYVQLRDSYQHLRWPILVAAAFGLIYFIVTAWLLEKKVEV